LDCNKDSQNIAASIVNGTAELGPFVLPLMHLKLGPMKNFVKAMNTEEAAFTYEKSSPD